MGSWLEYQTIARAVYEIWTATAQFMDRLLDRRSGAEASLISVTFGGSPVRFSFAVAKDLLSKQ